jgi:class 3 adenylate cyclase
MKYIESVASYIPGMIIDKILHNIGNSFPPEIPWRQKCQTVCLFCDISDFTALSETMSVSGVGAEGLAKHLNSYFSQMLRIISSDGDDVFKFAGDAMIVVWQIGLENIETTTRRAAQCACAIQEH